MAAACTTRRPAHARLGAIEPGTDPDPADGDDLRGERREPVVLAAAVVVVLPFFMPEKFSPGPIWLIPALQSGLLVAMLIADPGRVDETSVRIHRIRLTFVALLATGAAFATVALTVDLLEGGTLTNAPGKLLAAAALVFTDLVIAFAFVFWELADGGPGHRANFPVPHPDFAFPQHMSPDVARPGWRPVFVDYLYLSVTNSIAFSPTDVMPLAHWAKLVMSLQSVGALVLLGLVVARAVNVLN
jgi:hypothetical protein